MALNQENLITELADAFSAALDFVADIRDSQPNAVRGDVELLRAVWDEALRTLAHRPRIAEELAEHLAPTRCGRAGCVNDAQDEIRHPLDGTLFCSGPCRDWHRQEEARKERAQRCMGPHCNARAGARRVFCSPDCRDLFPANQRQRELVAA